MMNFTRRDIISTLNMNRREMEEIFQTADRLEPYARKCQNLEILKDKILAVLFYQSSTRTRLSFEGAMHRLGGRVIGFSDPSSTRSDAKNSYGESLKDAICVIDKYADFIAMRHPVTGAAEEIAKHSQIPVLNGGDGRNEHPTQALLDLYTMRHYFGRLHNLHVVLVGDMTVRTMHSLPLSLARCDVDVTLIYPDYADFQDAMKEKLDEVHFKYNRADSLHDVIEEADVIYMNGLTHPSDMSDVEKSEGNKNYQMTKELLEKAKSNMILLHPLPRGDEIPKELDDSIHACYYEQAFLGMVIRMALLTLVAGREDLLP